MGEELPPVRRVRELVALGAGEVRCSTSTGRLPATSCRSGGIARAGVRRATALRRAPCTRDRASSGWRVRGSARSSSTSPACSTRSCCAGRSTCTAHASWSRCRRRRVRVRRPARGVRPRARRPRRRPALPGRAARAVPGRDLAGAAVAATARAVGPPARLRFTYAGPVADVDAVAELAMVGPAIEAVLVDADRIARGELDLGAAIRAATPN